MITNVVAFLIWTKKHAYFRRPGPGFKMDFLSILDGGPVKDDYGSLVSGAHW